MEAGNTGWNTVMNRTPEPVQRPEPSHSKRNRFQETVDERVRAERKSNEENLDERVDPEVLKEVMEDGFFTKTISGTRAGMHTRVSHQAGDLAADESFNFLSATFGKDAQASSLSIMDDPFGQHGSMGEEGNGVFLGRDKNVIRERLGNTKNGLETKGKGAVGQQGASAQAQAERQSVLEGSVDSIKSVQLDEGDLLSKARQHGKDSHQIADALLLKSLDAAAGQNGFTTNLATATSRVMTSIVQHIQTDPTLFLTVYPQYARVSIELQEGEKLNLEMRMKDGCADVRAVGQSASILEGKTHELRQALEEAGMMLGEFSLESNESQQNYEQDDDQNQNDWRSSKASTDATADVVAEDVTHHSQTQRRQKLEGRNHWVTA